MLKWQVEAEDKDEALSEASWQLAEALAEAAAVTPLQKELQEVRNTCSNAITARIIKPRRFVVVLPKCSVRATGGHRQTGR